jgi:hypothetical protein
MSSFMPLCASAYNNNHFYSSNDILFYDADAKGCVGNGNGPLVGNDNVEKILRYYVGKGLTLVQAAGIAGNIEAESSFNPATIFGGGQADESYNPVGGPAFGIIQWHDKGRQQGLVDLSKSTNRSIIDLSLQLDYSWQELSNNYTSTLDDLKNATTTKEASDIIFSGYEAPGDSTNSTRSGYADEIYNKFKTKISDGSSSTTTSSSACTGNGQASQFIDGFAIYSQTDPQWASNPYLGGTIGDIGCGIASMAMIITALTGQSVTPDQTAKIMNEEGGMLENVLPKHWGLNSEEISTTVTKVNDVLGSGGLVLAYGVGGSPFSQRGHYIVIRAVTSDRKWQIGDPDNSGNNLKDWDPDTIIQGGGTALKMWAVTK